MALEVLGNGWRTLLQRAHVDLLEQGSIDAATPLADSVATAACDYLDAVVKWNQKMDLTAARSPEELVDLSSCDAFVLASRTPVGANEWIDIGAGAGAPGILLQLLRPELKLTLVEPRSKRVAFLRSVCGTLGLSTSIRRERSQSLTPLSADVASSRATLSPGEWLEEGGRLARSAVWVLLATGEAPTANHGWRLKQDVHYTWPLTGVPRRALCYVPEPR